MPTFPSPSARPKARKAASSEADPVYFQASHHLADVDETSFVESYRPVDSSNKQSPNVYVDEQEGSDIAGIGTRQAPYHSISKAVQERPEATVYYKKRFLCHLNEFNPAEVPATAIPVRVGGFVTTYWYLLGDSRRQQALEQVRKQQEAPPAYGNLSSAKSSTSSFFSFSSLKKTWTR